MYQVIKTLEFCYGHRLLDYEGPCRNLHGHNARVELVLESSDLNSHGMVRDFIEVKEVMGRWIDDQFDHRMLLERDDPLVPVLKDRDPIHVLDVQPTAENLARLIFEHARKQGFPIREVRLWESSTSVAVYGSP